MKKKVKFRLIPDEQNKEGFSEAYLLRDFVESAAVSGVLRAFRNVGLRVQHTYEGKGARILAFTVEVEEGQDDLMDQIQLYDHETPGTILYEVREVIGDKETNLLYIGASSESHAEEMYRKAKGLETSQKVGVELAEGGAYVGAYHGVYEVRRGSLHLVSYEEDI